VELHAHNVIKCRSKFLKLRCADMTDARKHLWERLAHLLLSYAIIRNLLESVFNILLLQYSRIGENAKDTYTGHFTAASVALSLLYAAKRWMPSVILTSPLRCHNLFAPLHVYDYYGASIVVMSRRQRRWVGRHVTVWSSEGKYEVSVSRANKESSGSHALSTEQL
jgi:hypothetical protein